VLYIHVVRSVAIAKLKQLKQYKKGISNKKAVENSVQLMYLAYTMSKKMAST